MAASASAPSALTSWTTSIREMLAVKKPVIFDCRVTKQENCFLMIVSGKAHNEMTLAMSAA
jgi:acetolactate synthase-1/2/3 large subunit